MLTRIIPISYGFAGLGQINPLVFKDAYFSLRHVVVPHNIRYIQN